MAQVGLPPEAIPPDINFKCHPKQINTTVFCILCDSVFHKSDFNRKKGVNYVTSVQVICDDHTDITPISDDPRVLHINLNKALKNKDQENKLLTTKFNKLAMVYFLLNIFNSNIELPGIR